MKLSDPIHRFLPEWRDVEVSVERPDGSVELVDTEQPISVKHASMHMTGIGTGSPEARLNLEALVDGGGARSPDPSATAGVGTAGDFMWRGAASTAFWIDLAEDLFAMFMTQLIPSGAFHSCGQLCSLVYAPVTD